MARDFDAEFPTLTDLERAVIGPIPADRNLWRINWLRSLIQAIDDGELAVTTKSEDPSSINDCIAECREMVRDVNAAIRG